MSVYKLASESNLYDGWRKVIKRVFILGKQTFDFEVKKEGNCVCVLALTPDYKVILVKQLRPGPGKILLELPGGGSNDKANSPEDAFKRELLEETGYSGVIAQTGSSWDCGYSTRYRYHFVATQCKKIQESENNPNEPIEVILMPLKDFINHLHSGELTDSETAYRGLEKIRSKRCRKQRIC